MNLIWLKWSLSLIQFRYTIFYTKRKRLLIFMTQNQIVFQAQSVHFRQTWPSWPGNYFTETQTTHTSITTGKIPNRCPLVRLTSSRLKKVIVYFLTQFVSLLYLLSGSRCQRCKSSSTTAAVKHRFDDQHQDDVRRKLCQTATNRKYSILRNPKAQHVGSCSPITLSFIPLLVLLIIFESFIN